MHILIIGYFYLPTGMASSARIRNIAYGFKSANTEVSIVALKKNFYEAEEMSIISKMEAEGMHLDYALDGSENFSILQKIQSHKIIGKIFRDKAKAIHAKKKIDAIFLYGVSYNLHAPLIKLAKSIKAITILDIVEYRLKMLTPRIFFKDPQTLDIARGALTIPKQVDIICTISKTLYNKYSEKKYKYLLPGIEEWPPESNLEVPQSESKTFVFLYIGILLPRDNPSYLLELFTEACRKNKNIRLTLVGNYMASPNKDYWPKKFKTQLGEKVDITGKVTERRMLNLKNNANAFVLTRANNLPEICAFPTRMLEFLKQRKPTFISDVGDIPEYLNHMSDTCILSGNLSDDLENLLAISNNKILANKLANNGYKKGAKHFDRDQHMKQLVQLIQNFNESKKA